MVRLRFASADEAAASFRQSYERRKRGRRRRATNPERAPKEPVGPRPIAPPPPPPRSPRVARPDEIGPDTLFVLVSVPIATYNDSDESLPQLRALAADVYQARAGDGQAQPWRGVMPRLHGYVEYRFVEPGYVHPKGYQVDVVTVADLVARNHDVPFEQFLDECARKQEAFADLWELDAVQCEKYHHTLAARPTSQRTSASVECTPPSHRTAAMSGQLPGEFYCQARARRARASTRTAERTVFVRVHIPVG